MKAQSDRDRSDLPVAGEELCAAADKWLRARGNFDPTADEYFAALAAVSEEDRDEVVNVADPGGHIADAVAMSVLRDQGKATGYTAAEYASALDVAAERIRAAVAKVAS